jgi:hypothetical protein
MSETVPPLSQYAFVTWCSVKKAQEQLYFFLPLGMEDVRWIKLIQDTIKYLIFGENVGVRIWKDVVAVYFSVPIPAFCGKGSKDISRLTRILAESRNWRLLNAS